MAGIKETKDLAVAAEALAETALATMADGKLDLGDIRFAPALIQAFNTAVNGLGEVPVELKDLSAEEAQELAVATTAALFKLAQAYKVVRDTLHK